jgi:hypothetical protein
VLIPCGCYEIYLKHKRVRKEKEEKGNGERKSLLKRA